MNKSHGAACMAALAAALLLGAGLSGCSKKAETTSTPSASATSSPSATDPQNQLSGSGTAAKSALGVTPKQQLEDALLEELAANGGQAPDTVDCVGDLQATTGQTIEDVMNWERDIAQVTLEDVNKAARTAFDARASVTGILLPEAAIQ